MVQLERRGIPTAAIVSKVFDSSAKTVAGAMGMPSLRVANVPDIVTGLEPDMIRQEVEAALPDIYRILTTAAEGPQTASLELAAPPASIERYQGSEPVEALRAMNETFLKNQWSDGFPIEPPT